MGFNLLWGETFKEPVFKLDVMMERRQPERGSGGEVQPQEGGLCKGSEGWGDPIGRLPKYLGVEKD